MASKGTVLISGIGIAGASLAYWLGRAGYETVLVEKAPRFRTGGYVMDFWGLGYEIAERMGLSQELTEVGYHVREMRIVGDKGQRMSSFNTAAIYQVTGDRYITIRRSELARLLFSKARAAETIFGQQLVALSESNNGVEAKFESGEKRHFDLVIGADGLHSGVRNLVFGPQQDFEHDLGYFVAAFEIEGYTPRNDDVYVTHGAPGKSIGRFTLRDDRALFLFVCEHSGPVPHSHEGQVRLLMETYAGVGWEVPRILECLNKLRPEIYVDRVSQIKMPCWSKGRVALVGDAAFCVSLLAGQGSALALIASYVLAGELLKADGRYQEAFAAYEQVLRSFIEGKQRGAAHFARALTPHSNFGLWFRNRVLNAFAIPGIARLAIGHDLADRLNLPHYSWPEDG